MKKNLLSILILALLIVNLILTSIMMFSVTSSSNKTGKLVGDIATILNLEIGTGNDASASPQITIDNTEVYDIEEPMLIPFLRGQDEKDHYCSVSITLSLNKKDKDFKTYGAKLESKESLVKSEIIEVISSYTYDEAIADPKAMRDEILVRIQSLFDSKFIFEVAFRNVMFQ